MWYIFIVYFSLKEVVVQQVRRESDGPPSCDRRPLANDGRGVHGNNV